MYDAYYKMISRAKKTLVIYISLKILIIGPNKTRQQN